MTCATGRCPTKRRDTLSEPNPQPSAKITIDGRRRVLVLLSGGMDSATVLGRAMYEKAQDGIQDVRALSFDYGSTHSRWELDGARAICDFYKVSHSVINIKSVFEFSHSALLPGGPPVPEGHYQEENMRQTVVPGRNLILLSIAAGLAESQGYGEVWIGAHSGDHYIYPDCRPEFIHAAMLAIANGSDGRVVIQAPFLDGDKTSILKWGVPAGVPYIMTRTCYTMQEIACGRCGSCQERLEAFELNGLTDPIDYETRELLPKQGG